MNDIASVAGVSLATVDRVLNQRPGVRAVTVERVHKAIKELGYVRDTAAANLARGRLYSITFILPKTRNQFVAALRQQIDAQAEKLAVERTEINTLTADPFDPQEFVRILDALDPNRTDGIALFAPETPSVRDAVRRAHERGIAVAALVSDLPTTPRAHFVGIDNVAAGRTAARLMGRFIHGPGKVLVVADSRLSREHLERRQGFDALAHEDFPSLEVLPSIEGHEDSALIASMLKHAFETNPDILGIYATSSIDAGILDFLRESRRASQIVVITHELTALSRTGLEDGTVDAVISQDAGHLIRSATRRLRATADKAPFNETQERIRIDIYLKDNLGI